MISVIIPTYNEEDNIKKLIEGINEALHGLKREIIVVDDDSTDQTRDLAEMYKNVVIFHRTSVRGIWSAIRDGIEMASGDVIITMDADLSHPPKLIPIMLEHLKHYDMVTASRFIKGGDIVAPLMRTKYASMYLNILMRFVLGIKQHDITGGFHVIRKKDFDTLEFKYPAKWGEFDLEWFYRAKHLKIKEVPFVQYYRQTGDSKSMPLIYVWYYLWRTFTLRFWK